MIDPLNNRPIYAYIDDGRGLRIEPIGRTIRIGGCAWGFYMHELVSGEMIDGAYCTVIHYDY